MCKPVEYPAREYFIHPYILGAFIGDGYLLGSTPVITNPYIDGDIHERIASLVSHGYVMKSVKNQYVPHYSISKNGERPNKYMAEFKRLGLNVKSELKHVPQEYLYGDVQQRKDLLAGLMDTDGTISKGAKMCYSTTSERLANDVVLLVQSLGGKAKVGRYEREGKPVEYRTAITIPFNPFYTKRKREAFCIRKSNYNSRYIKSVEYVGEEECQCIYVDSKEHTYLTDSYIVTHNTLQSIGIVDAADAYPCLVICPSSLKINWQREFEKFTDKKALVLDNSTRTTWPYLLQMRMHHVAVVNYESLRKYFVWDVRGGKSSFRLKDVVFCPQIRKFKSVIIDESHRVKDPSAQQTIFTKGICCGKEWVILLSGTPVVNRPEDLVAQLSIMGRLNEFGGKAQFLAEYGEGENLAMLSDSLYSRCMIRREKAKVLTQLPAKTRCDLYVDISNRDEYDLAANDLAEYLRTYKECTDREIRRKMRMEALVRFMTLRSVAAKGKVRQAIDFVRVFLDSEKPLILFCSLHEIVDELKKAFPDAVTVTGRDSMTSKQAAVDAFQEGRARLIICSIKAAGVGLTLTASSNVAFVELPWTYADCCQCEDRAHRIGQKDNVTCYYLLGRGTIDRTLYQIIHRKKSIASEIMASSDDIPEDEQYFDELMDAFLQPSLFDNE